MATFIPCAACGRVNRGRAVCDVAWCIKTAARPRRVPLEPRQHRAFMLGVTARNRFIDTPANYSTHQMTCGRGPWPKWMRRIMGRCIRWHARMQAAEARR